MLKTLLGALALLALSVTAQAETFEFPSEAPKASVTFPDNWKAEETEEGLQGFSEGDEIAFYVEITNGTDVQAAVDKQIKFLSDNGVTVDPTTLKQSEEPLNGRNTSFSYMDGKDENGPVIVGMYFIEITPDSMVMITNWASKDENGGFAENLQKEVLAILASVKPVGAAQ